MFTMNTAPHPPNTVPPSGVQPVFVQTAYGPAFYNPVDGSLHLAGLPGAVIYPQGAPQQRQLSRGIAGVAAGITASASPANLAITNPTAAPSNPLHCLVRYLLP